MMFELMFFSSDINKVNFNCPNKEYNISKTTKKSTRKRRRKPRNKFKQKTNADTKDKNAENDNNSGKVRNKMLVIDE